MDQDYNFTTIPNAGLVADDGNLYGTTHSEGAGPGTVFKMTSSGAVTTIYSFTNGDQPANGLVEGPDGALYGMTYGSVYKITKKGKLTTLHVFDPADGPQRGGPLLVGRDGVLYGMTGDEHPSGAGTIFSITPDGKYRTATYDCSHIRGVRWHGRVGPGLGRESLRRDPGIR